MRRKKRKNEKWDTNDSPIEKDLEKFRAFLVTLKVGDIVDCDNGTVGNAAWTVSTILAIDYDYIRIQSKIFKEKSVFMKRNGKFREMGSCISV